MRLSLTKWEVLLGATESPIEQAFLTAFCEAAHQHGYRVARTPSANDVIAVKPQQWIGPYRVDFSIALRFFDVEIGIIVETDGHEFHEKTKHQAARDKKRDRFLDAHYQHVQHFTGQQIFLSAGGCALEALNLIMEFQTRQCAAAAKTRPAERTA